MVAPHSLIPGQELSPPPNLPAVQEILTEQQGLSNTTSLLSVVFVTVCHSWDSKLQILKELAQRGSTPSSGLESCCTVTNDLCPKKQSHACSVHGIYGVAPGKAVSYLSTLCVHLRALPMKGHILAPTGSFVLEEATIYPFPGVLQEGERSLPVQLRRSLHQFVRNPGPEPSFSPGV